MLPSDPFPDIIGHSIRLSVRPTSVVTLYREFKLDDQGRAAQPLLIPFKAVLYLHSESFYSAGLITSVLSMGIKKTNQWVIFTEDKECHCIFIPEVLIVLY